jgi:hypothetical protein
VHYAAVFEALTRLCPADTIIAVDVGNNTYSFGRYFESQGQRVLMSGYLGSIGFGFPAAIGAWAATQDFAEFKGRKVISISGDGGFGQYAMEFTTAVKYGMDITHILLNNAELGKIAKEQRAGEFQVWETGLHNPSFAMFAKQCGGHGARVTAAHELDAAFATALAFKGPSLVEIVTDPELVGADQARVLGGGRRPAVPEQLGCRAQQALPRRHAGNHSQGRIELEDDLRHFGQQALTSHPRELGAQRRAGCIAAGQRVLAAMMEADRIALCGPKGVPDARRRAVRGCSTASQVVLGGQRSALR